VVQLSRTSKIIVVLATIAGLFAFLVVVDLGVNAGRIHYGVSVSGVDLGGLTDVEATEKLRREARKVENDLVILLTAVGLNVPVTPKQLGWRPRLDETVERAHRVGRDDAPFGALSDRAASWLWGVKLHWAGATQPKKVYGLIRSWERQIESVGNVLDRDRLRAILRRAIRTGDGGPYEFPVTPADS
jgi:hypothetical protein